MVSTRVSYLLDATLSSSHSVIHGRSVTLPIALTGSEVDRLIVHLKNGETDYEFLDLSRLLAGVAVGLGVYADEIAQELVSRGPGVTIGEITRLCRVDGGGTSSTLVWDKKRVA